MNSPTNFAECITGFFTKYLSTTRNLSPNTIKSYRDTFFLLMVFLKEKKNMKIEKITLETLDFETIQEYLEWLETDRNNAAKTQNQRLAAIHSFFKYVQMYHPELMMQCQRVISIPFKKTTTRTVAYLSEETVKKLLASPDQSDKYGLRDAALLSLLYDSGARVQEIIDATLTDIQCDVPATLRIYGKGRKVRTVPLMKNTGKLVKKYMDAWSLDSKEIPNHPLFFNRQGRKLSRPGVTYILRKHMPKGSEDSNKTVTPHILRHSKAMHLLHAGVDMHYIRDFLGHVYLETTQIYAKADAETKRKAFEKAAIKLPEQENSWQKDKDLLSWLMSL